MSIGDICTSGHGYHHAFIEKKLIECVVNKGWLNGKLKRPEKPKRCVKEVRAERILAGIKKWEREEKLAKTKLKKLRSQLKRYKRLGVVKV